MLSHGGAVAASEELTAAALVVEDFHARTKIVLPHASPAAVRLGAFFLGCGVVGVNKFHESATSDLRSLLSGMEMIMPNSPFDDDSG